MSELLFENKYQEVLMREFEKARGRMWDFDVKVLDAQNRNRHASMFKKNYKLQLQDFARWVVNNKSKNHNQQDYIKQDYMSGFYEWVVDDEPKRTHEISEGELDNFLSSCFE